MGRADTKAGQKRLSTLYGRVYENWLRINPERKPTILFAPGVPESLWFTQQFCRVGVPAAHIDGSQVYFDGRLQESTPELRDEVIEGSRTGRFVVISNRFVMREGVDAPWLAHGIFATVFGSLGSYIQSGGRLLRSFPGLDHVTIQDHGGNYWRHGSLNENRVWKLNDTGYRLTVARADRHREGEEEEPYCCPECGLVLRTRRCTCGFVFQAALRVRPVLTLDGRLIQQSGPVFKARKRQNRPGTAKLWESIYCRAYQAKKPMSFRQAEALFVREYYYWPPRDLPLMPRDGYDFTRHVREVATEELNGPAPYWLVGWRAKRDKKSPPIVLPPSRSGS
jgi:superfamily II DNA or RNA helicase